MNPPTPERPSKDLLEQMLRQAQRVVAKTNVAEYIEYVFGQKPAAHHLVMLDFALDIINGKKSGVLLAPRGSGKTTILNTGLLSWLVAIKPDIRIGILSQKAEKAEAMSAALMGIIDASEEYRDIFGDLHGVKWSAREWLRKDSPHIKSKDRTVVAAGADQSSSVVSKRFDVIFCDDILDENNTYNIDRREKMETWFWKSLKPTQAAEGCAVLVVGTRWVEDDLYQKLIEQNKWPSLVIPAITVDEQDRDISYWPSVWPLSRLYAEREDVGWDNFACSYLNDISGLRDGVVFKKDWWKDSHFDELPADRTYTYSMGVDLASSERERADFTAYVIVAESERHEHFVLRTRRIKTQTGHREFVEEGWHWAASQGFTISRIIIETNQHQSTFVQDLVRNTNLPAVGRRADVDKVTRARAAAARYESHRIYHHRSLEGRELENEMLGFPKGHDDLIDALGLALDLTVGAGSIGVASGAPRPSEEPTGPIPEMGTTVIFRSGPRYVPAHIAALLTGIRTEDYEYEEALRLSDQKRLTAFIKASMGQFLPR